MPGDCKECGKEIKGTRQGWLESNANFWQVYSMKDGDLLENVSFCSLHCLKAKLDSIESEIEEHNYLSPKIYLEWGGDPCYNTGQLDSDHEADMYSASFEDGAIVIELDWGKEIKFKKVSQFKEFMKEHWGENADPEKKEAFLVAAEKYLNPPDDLFKEWLI